MKVTLKKALLGLVALVLLVGLVPAGLLLDRRLVAALEQGVRDDLVSAPLVLGDRMSSLGSARMMHAQEISAAPGLASAMLTRDSAVAVARATDAARAFPGEEPVVVDAEGASWIGPTMPAHLLDSTRAGVSPVLVVEADGALGTAALAPVQTEALWTGAAGVWVPMDADEAAHLAALTRSNVLLVGPDGALAGYSGLGETAMGLFERLLAQPATEDVRELDFGGERYLVVAAALPGGARVAFTRSLGEELAIVPSLRAVGAGVFAIALLVALAVGAWFAGRLASPVGSLAIAATGVGEGRFDASVRRSGVVEVDQVAEAFEVMRDALALRIRELGAANAELEDRQARLSVLQAELVQRDRLSAASRLLQQLAHEVRNPVASVRNCLEILRRRVEGDEEASELADLAIDELLRMHELTEQMLDLNRPRAEGGSCDAAEVVEDVATLVRMGLGEASVEIRTDASEEIAVEMGADALKQVLLNLVQNAQEALDGAGAIEIRVAAVGANARIDVLDDGPGFDADSLPQVFDPFYTTKADVRGVGLGLFTAAGLARSHGGRIAAANRSDGRGARLSVEVPLVDAVREEASA